MSFQQVSSISLFFQQFSNIAIRRGAQNMSTASPRSDRGEQVERVSSDRASEDTYEMSDDDYREDRTPSISRAIREQQYEGSTNVFIGLATMPSFF